MSEKHWVVAQRMDDERWDYWSNEYGWGSLEEATCFTEDERNAIFLLPIDGEWKRVENSDPMIDAAPQLYTALLQLVNYNEADPDLYVGDDDGVLGRIMYEAQVALGAATRREG